MLIPRLTLSLTNCFFKIKISFWKKGLKLSQILREYEDLNLNLNALSLNSFIRYSFRSLNVKLSLNLKDSEKAKKWLEGKIDLGQIPTGEKAKIKNDRTNI